MCLVPCPTCHADDQSCHTSSACSAAIQLANLNRRQLQQKAVAAGIKANGKSSEIVKALEALNANAGKGFDAFMKTAGMEMMNNKWEKPDDRHGAEREELADLAFLGIAGRTPGGTRWRNKAMLNVKKNPPPMLAPLSSVQERAELEL